MAPFTWMVTLISVVRESCDMGIEAVKKLGKVKKKMEEKEKKEATLLDDQMTSYILILMKF